MGYKAPTKKKPVAKPTAKVITHSAVNTSEIAAEIWDKLCKPVYSMQNRIDEYYIERSEASKKNDRVLLIAWIVIIICYVIIVFASLKKK